jgi:putative thioredoxin
MDLRTAPPKDDGLIKDATEATFMADVIDASMEVPVIVDFWAQWCGPCKQLTPALEEAVRAARGKVRLVKVDVDRNQMIASQLRIQSIPTVYAFVKGQPVDAFHGRPAPVADQAVHRAADRDGRWGRWSGGGARPGRRHARRGRSRRRRAGLCRDPPGGEGESPRDRRACPLSPRHEGNRQGQGHSRAGAEGQGRRPRLSPAFWPRSRWPRRRPALARPARAAPGSSATRTTIRRATTSRWRWWRAATRAGAVDELLELFRRDREWNEGVAKQQLFKLFDSLGPKSEIAQKGRRRLSSMIFS